MLRRDSDNKNEALVNYQDIVFGKILGSCIVMEYVECRPQGMSRAVNHKNTAA